MRNWILLAALPTATTIIIWTNPLHHWFRGQPFISTIEAPFPVLVNDYQFWFYYIHAPAGYLYILAAILVMLTGLRTLQPIHRQQTLLLLVALLLPVCTDIAYILGYSPIRYYNLTPAVFSISGLLITWNLFHYRLLDLVPMARSLVVENMQEGIIVLDHQNRIVDFNPVAQRITSLTASAVGQTPQEIHTTLLNKVEELTQKGELRAEITVGEAPSLVYEMQISPVRDPSNRLLGTVVTLQDVTERAVLFEKIRYAATHDGLTDVLNRQQFIELGTHEFERARHKYHCSISIIMFDLDRFKSINDLYGHSAGDLALVAITEFCRKNLRPADIFGRLGGDEFAAILMNISIAETVAIAERLCTGILSLTIQLENQKIPLRASFGVISSSSLSEEDCTLDNMLRLADQALYQAKEKGGNCVVTPQLARAS